MYADETTPLTTSTTGDASDSKGNYSEVVNGNRPRARSASDTSRRGERAVHDNNGDQHEELHVTFDPDLPEDEPEPEWDGVLKGRQRSSSLAETLEEIKEVIVEKMGEVKEVIGEGLEEIKEEIKEVLHEPILPVKPREEGDHSQKLSAIALAVLVFYKVSGGPFGCEPTVRSAGPFYGLIGFIVFPIIWCIPEALVTAELGSAYPEPSGAIAWVEEAFGPQAGLLCGYFHWVSGATDNAIYPSLFLEYVASFLSTQAGFNMANDVMRFGFCVIMTAVLSVVNYSGLEIVGNLSIVVAVISLSPFLVMCVIGYTKVNWSRLFILPVPVAPSDDDVLTGASWFPDPVWMGILWRPYLNNLFWNLNSFDVGANFAGEVKDPERVFPRAMFLSVGLVTLGYILPLIAVLGSLDSDQSDWNAGFLASAASQLGGQWLGIWTVFASAISNVALFEAEMSGDAYSLMGMADRGLIPKLFRKRSRFGTPTNGILLSFFVIIALSVADFDALVEMLNFAYCLSMIMELAAFVRLRITEPDVNRPYKVPLGTVGCALFVTPPIILCMYLMFIASRMTYIYFAVLTAFGVLFYIGAKAAKHHHWCEFSEPPKKKKRGSNHTV